MQKCPVCKGRTQIHARENGLLNVDALGIIHDYWIDCPTCKATGVIDETPLKDRVVKLEDILDKGLLREEAYGLIPEIKKLLERK